jgi:hypothetical protein
MAGIRPQRLTVARLRAREVVSTAAGQSRLRRAGCASRRAALAGEQVPDRAGDGGISMTDRQPD